MKKSKKKNRIDGEPNASLLWFWPLCVKADLDRKMRRYTETIHCTAICSANGRRARLIGKIRFGWKRRCADFMASCLRKMQIRIGIINVLCMLCAMFMNTNSENTFAGPNCYMPDDFDGNSFIRHTIFLRHNILMYAFIFCACLVLLFIRQCYNSILNWRHFWLFFFFCWWICAALGWAGLEVIWTKRHSPYIILCVWNTVGTLTSGALTICVTDTRNFPNIMFFSWYD